MPRRTALLLLLSSMVVLYRFPSSARWFASIIITLSHTLWRWGTTVIIARSERFVIGGGPDFGIRKILSGAYGETLIDVSGQEPIALSGNLKKTLGSD
jgi:hypothetical protein